MRALAEVRERAGARALGLAAVQRAGVDAHRAQLLGEPVHVVLGAHEHDRAALAGGDLGRPRSACPRADTSSTWCSIVVTLAVAGATECVTGSCRYWRTSLSTSPSSVAENSRRWPSGGVRSRIARTWGMKPMSAIWSASSSAVISTSDRSQVPWRTWSDRRPGVATSRSTPRRSWSTWRGNDMPPTTTRHQRPSERASGVSASPPASRARGSGRGSGRAGLCGPATAGRRGGTAARGRTPASCRSRSGRGRACRGRRARRAGSRPGSGTAR